MLQSGSKRKTKYSAQADDFRAHPASYTMGTGVSLPGAKRPGREVDHSPPFSAEFKNNGAILLLLPYVFMAQCFIN
jgi:hypothetical protein